MLIKNILTVVTLVTLSLGGALLGPSTATAAEMSPSDSLAYRVQSGLKHLGYNPGPLDGIVGPRTMDAVTRFESAAGMAPSGKVTAGLEEALINKAVMPHIKAAKAAQKKANSVGGEWRDTGKMIKKAEKLLKEGKAKEAAKLAQEAEAQGMLGYMQATSQTKDNLHI